MQLLGEQLEAPVSRPWESISGSPGAGQQPPQEREGRGQRLCGKL